MQRCRAWIIGSLIAGLGLALGTLVVPVSAAPAPEIMDRVVVCKGTRFVYQGRWEIRCSNGLKHSGATPDITMLGYDCQTEVFPQAGSSRTRCVRS
jgi:hypothetical protein